MTTIVGIGDGLRVVMAADGQHTAGSEIVTRAARKIGRFQIVGEEHALLGVAGQPTVLTTIARNMAWPPLGAHLDDWADAVARELLMTARESKLPVMEDDHLDSTGLLGFRGLVWVLSGYGGAHRAARGFEAIGSGADYAMGALMASTIPDARDRAAQAVDIASHLDVYSGGEIFLMVEENYRPADEPVDAPVALEARDIR